LVYGPGDSLQDHTPKESISLQDYKKAVNVLSNVLGWLVKG
jgi:acetylornithine deacetylase/succinyl-diaminopimelate desuccinylase-like protein